MKYVRNLTKWYNADSLEKQPIEGLDNFFQKYQLLTLKRKDVLFHSHDKPSGVYYLKSGFVRSYAVSLSGEEFTQIIFKERDFFPINWSINNTKNLHTYEAMTDIEVWKAPRQDFQAYIRSHPDVIFELIKRIAIRLKGTQERIEELAFGNANHKVASILLICADRFGVKTTQGIEIQVPLTHKDLATLVGLTRETVSIEMNKLKKEGAFVAKNGKILIIKKSVLEEHATVSALPEGL